MAQNLYNEPLISAEDMRQWCKFTETISEEGELHPLILNAQQLDLEEALGSAFMYDLLENRNDTKYKILMDGEKYEYAGRNYAFSGLRPALCYYTHARYLLDRNNNDGPFGMQTKTSEYGEAVSGKELQRMSNTKKQIADGYLMKVKHYLTAKKETYTLYGADECLQETPVGNFKITKID
jgi:hypothetical protein